MVDTWKYSAASDCGPFLNFVTVFGSLAFLDDLCPDLRPGQLHLIFPITAGFRDPKCFKKLVFEHLPPNKSRDIEPKFRCDCPGSQTRVQAKVDREKVDKGPQKG